MPKIVAWTVFGLGIAHLVFGVVRFKAPLLDAFSAGFVGQFRLPESRRTAFWFLMIGPFLMLVGHLSIRAVLLGDWDLLRLVGVYMLVSSVIGVAAFPVSPLWAPLLLSLPLIAIGIGWLR